MSNLPPTEYFKKLEQIKLSESARARMQGELDAYVTFHPVPSSVRVGDEYRFIEQVPVSTSWFTKLRNIHIMPMTFAILIALMISGGTTFAAQSALPGDFLYPVKVEVNENIKSVFTFGADAEAELQADLLAERVTEVETLQARGELTAEESIAIANRMRAQSNEVREASEESSPTIRASARAEAVISLERYNSLVDNDGSLVVDIATIAPPVESDGGTTHPPVDIMASTTTRVDCSRIPATLGPESITWKEACEASNEIDTKVNITNETPVRSRELPFDCDTPPATMGPESIAWQEACVQPVEESKVEASSSININLR